MSKFVSLTLAVLIWVCVSWLQRVLAHCRKQNQTQTHRTLNAYEFRFLRRSTSAHLPSWDHSCYRYQCSYRPDSFLPVSAARRRNQGHTFGEREDIWGFLTDRRGTGTGVSRCFFSCSFEIQLNRMSCHTVMYGKCFD